jgi:hypothetical protein
LKKWMKWRIMDGNLSYIETPKNKKKRQGEARIGAQKQKFGRDFAEPRHHHRRPGQRNP